jgi:hypothetical protein
VKIPLHGLRQAVLLCLLLTFTWQSHAAWFEAQGQGAIVKGNKQKAKQDAIEQALKQALLFAGASITSVQQLSHGLLNQDSLEISALGEVNSLELISETWHQDYVTVALRADIFPQSAQCMAADFKKSLVSSYFPVMDKQQLSDGQMQKIGQVISERIGQQVDKSHANLRLAAIAPYTIQWQQAQVLAQAPSLARQYRAQYALVGVIEDMSVHRPEKSTFTFWGAEAASRNFVMNIEVIDGANGASVFSKRYHTQALWEFDRFSQLDIRSATFWESPFGMKVTQLLDQAISDVAGQLNCQPATGRVLQVASNQLQISLGRIDGLMPGDELSLYQLKQVTDNFGQTYTQYRLHPTKVTVLAAFSDNATVTAVDGSLLANIQPNDFVAKQ